MNKRIQSRLIAVMWGTAIGLYVILSFRNFGGFPLDDAWIHQTYARNLAQLGEWSFLPGQLSAGSTSPLWSLVLALGYLVNVPYIGWIIIIGGLSMIYLAITGRELIGKLTDAQSRILWLPVFVLLFDWRNVWASLSGMETLLYTLMILLALYLLLTLDWHMLWHGLLIGAVCGLVVWLRPEGITILGPVFWVLLFSEAGWREKAKRLGLMLLGLFLLLIPYGWLNVSLSGQVLPNTFVAKQTEYAALLEQTIFTRIMNLSLQPLIGVGVVLLPGALYEIYYSLKSRAYASLSIFLWGAGIILIYALRLPVIYQHGRYIMPAISILLVYSLLGFVRWWAAFAGERKWWLISRTWITIIIVLTAAFWILGAQSYTKDVAIIESEMVDAARWTAENLPEDALIAAHDIGALGYFGEHEILDLAGLITPEVIPFMRDEGQLAEYLDEQGADYLVTFEGWYPELEAQAQLLYSTGSEISRKEGSTNMAVYQWGAEQQEE